MGDSGLRPYAELLDSFLCQRISVGEFEQRYVELFKADNEIRPDWVFEVLDRLFADVDAYSMEFGDEDESLTEPQRMVAHGPAEFDRGPDHVVVRPRCVACGNPASYIELVPPGSLPAAWDSFSAENARLVSKRQRSGGLVVHFRGDRRRQRIGGPSLA
jgi:self-protective colicin-like immunity protein